MKYSQHIFIYFKSLNYICSYNVFIITYVSSKTTYVITLYLYYFFSFWQFGCLHTQALVKAWKFACRIPRSTVLLPSGHRFLISPVTLQGPCNTRLTLQVATPLSLTHTSKSCIFTLKIMHFLLFIFHLENSVILWSNANWEVVFFFF